MDNIAGSPVEGPNFHAREADIARLRETLENHDILLLGARRIGKTSIARAVIAQVRSEGWRAIEINVASCSDECAFLDKLDAKLKPELGSLAEKLKDVVGEPIEAITRRIKSVKLALGGAGSVDIGVGTAETEDWTQVANDLLRLIARAEQRWLIYIDELPIFLFNIIRADKQNGVRRVRRFLDWFRNDVRAMPDVKTVRWLVSGSIGLDTLAQQHGMADTINSMKHEGLEAFSDQEAANMLGKLAARYQIPWSEEDATKLIAAVLWPQPYYLQLVFHHLRDLGAASPLTKVQDLLEHAIDKMVQPGVDNDFHHWEQRLLLQLSDSDASHGLALLTLAAQTPAGERPEALLAELQGRMPNATTDEVRRAFIVLRDILQRDAYWCPDETSGHRRYRFRLEPLRLWWLRRNAL